MDQPSPHAPPGGPSHAAAAAPPPPELARRRSTDRDLARRWHRLFAAASLLALVLAAGLAYLLGTLVQGDSRARTVAQQARAVHLLPQLLNALPALDERLFQSGPTGTERRQLEAVLTAARQTGDIESLTLWAKDGRAVYSSNRQIEGRRLPPSGDVRAALEGRTVSKDDSHPSPSGDGGPVRVYEVYEPVPSAGRPIGALEVAVPADLVHGSIPEVRDKLLLWVCGASIALWLLLLPLTTRLARFAAEKYDPRQKKMLGALERAIRNRDLELHYQPQMSLSTGSPCRVEALVRWRRGKVLVPPGDFLPDAERSPLIVPLTDLVVDEAFAQAGEWHRQGRGLQVAVNLSPVNLRDESLPRRIEGALAKHGVPAGMIVVEVTETAVLEEPERTRGVLDRIAELGVTVSVDDFGTGYSSLLWLQLFPVSEIKVDRTFVAQLTGEGRAYVAGAIRLAHDLKLTVVAEGVEDEHQLKVLQDLECDVGQGYLFSAPLPVGEVEEWLSSQPAGAWIRRTTEFEVTAGSSSALEDARSFIDTAASEFDLGPEDTWDVKLAATEALSNAMEHGNGDEGRIHMRLAQEDDELVVYISNSGTFRQELPTSASRGRGIALMTLLMDEVEMRRGADNMLVRLAKRLNREENGDGVDESLAPPKLSAS